MSNSVSWRHNTRNSMVFFKAADTLGLNLGELRALVVLAEDLPDNAQVNFDDVQRSYTYVDEYTARVVKVRAERKAD